MIVPAQVSQLYSILNELVAEKRMYTSEVISILEKAGLSQGGYETDPNDGILYELWTDEDGGRYTFNVQLNNRQPEARSMNQLGKKTQTIKTNENDELDAELRTDSTTL